MRTDQSAYQIFNAEDRTFLARMFTDHPGIGERFDAFLALRPEVRAKHALDVLKQLPRRGWQLRGVVCPENVFDHMRDVTGMARSCPLPTDLPDMDADKARRKLGVMASLHDVAEAIVTDFTPHCNITPHDKDRLELLAGYVIFEHDAHGLGRLQEYIEQITPLSHLLHDLDKLAAVRQALIYEGMYPEKHGTLYAEFRDHAVPQLKTDQGRALAADIEAHAEDLRYAGRQKALQRKFAGRDFF